ncbi:MAG: hypothetical protein KCHDKBKB_00913 [Elusimicrobia bacterium]|nr:hypothetical protein [Elusimicrobiota bacterium]
MFFTNTFGINVGFPMIWSDRKKSDLSSPFHSSSLLPSISQPEMQRLVSLLQNKNGKIRSIRYANSNGKKSDKIVVLVQDIHRHYEAQSQIRKTLELLIKNQQVDLVGLEGGFGSINLKPFQQYPYPEDVEQAANYLLKTGELTGAYAAGLRCQSEPVPYIGIDDKNLYQLNVEAYKKSAPYHKANREKWGFWAGDLKRRTKSEFHTELYKFHEVVSSFRLQGGRLGDYISSLLRISPEVVRRFSPNALMFHQAINFEKKINLSLVEEEKKNLIEKLHGEVSSRKEIDLKKYPALDSYLAYVKLTEKIDLQKLFQELKLVESQMYGPLIASEKEKNMVEEFYSLCEVGKLLEFSFSKDEWDDYRINPTNSNVTKWVQEFHDLEPYENFYKYAELRDIKMASNFLNTMTQVNAKKGLVVAGGFHSQGITDYLVREGVSVITYVPTISTIESKAGQEHLSIFTKEKSPLEVLFGQDRLFLSQTPDSPFVQRLLANCVLAVADMSGRKTVAFRSLSHYFNRGLTWAGKFSNRVYTFVLNRSGLGCISFHFEEGVLNRRRELSIPFPRTITSAIHNLRRSILPSPMDHFEGPWQKVVNEFRDLEKKEEAQNLEEAFESVLNEYPELSHSPIVLVLREGGRTIANIENDKLVLDQRLLEFPELLKMELREELHHLLFHRLVLTIENRQPTLKELALEELSTDLHKLNYFSQLDFLVQENILQILMTGFDEHKFHHLLLGCLPADRRKKMGKKLNSAGHQIALNIVPNLNGNELVRIKVLRNFYLKTRIYSDLTPEFIMEPEILQNNVNIHDDDFSDLRQKYFTIHQPAELVFEGGVSFVPDVRKNQFTPKNIRAFLSFLGNPKDIVFIEPHPDDGAVGAGGLLYGLAQDPNVSTTLVSLFDDAMGVSDEFIEIRYGVMERSETKKEFKKTTRRFESNSHAAHRGIKYMDMEISSEASEPVILDDQGKFNPLNNDFFSLSESDLRKLTRYVRDWVKRGALFVIPYPFSKKAPGQNTKHVCHPHHKLAVDTLFRLLAEFNYTGPILFYEVPERHVSFDTEGVDPNIHLVFGHDEMKEKKVGINFYESQQTRKRKENNQRGYDVLIEELNRARAQNLSQDGFVELYHYGQLVSPHRRSNVEPLESVDDLNEGSTPLNNINAVILAGGKSLGAFPALKLLLPVGEFANSLIATVERLIHRFEEGGFSSFLKGEDVFVVPSKEIETTVNTQTLGSLPGDNILTIPTSASGDLNGILWAMANIKSRQQDVRDKTLIILPGDTIVRTPQRYRKFLHQAVQATQLDPNAIVLLGQIPPNNSQVSDWMRFGSIQINQDEPLGEGFYSKTFIEKPPQDEALEMQAQKGQWYWNMGVVVGRLETIENAVKHCEPRLFDIYEKMVSALAQSNNILAQDLYGEMSEMVPHPFVQGERIYPIFDYLISMRLNDNVHKISTVRMAVIPTDIYFHDIGSWSAIIRLMNGDSSRWGRGRSNILLGINTDIEVDEVSKNNVIYADHGMKVKLKGGVEGLVIGYSAIGVLIIDQKDAARVKKYVLQGQERADHQILEGSETSSFDIDSSANLVIAPGLKHLSITLRHNTLTVENKFMQELNGPIGRLDVENKGVSDYPTNDRSQFDIPEMKPATQGPMMIIKKAISSLVTFYNFIVNQFTHRMESDNNELSGNRKLIKSAGKIWAIRRTMSDA